MRNSVFRTVAMMRWVVVLACSCEDCAAAIPIALAPTTAIPIATATMTNLLMLRGMIASTYRTIVALYRQFDLRRCDLHHSFAFPGGLRPATSHLKTGLAAGPGGGGQERKKGGADGGGGMPKICFLGGGRGGGACPTLLRSVVVQC